MDKPNPDGQTHARTNTFRLCRDHRLRAWKKTKLNKLSGINTLSWLTFIEQTLLCNPSKVYCTMPFANQCQSHGPASGSRTPYYMAWWRNPQLYVEQAMEKRKLWHNSQMQWFNGSFLITVLKIPASHRGTYPTERPAVSLTLRK